MKRSARVVSFICFVSVVGISVFQNCSQPGAIIVTDPFASEKEAAAARLALGADDETVTVGLNPVPNLKMFFVVDNSGTMQKNQFNLSESFGAMFDPNSSESLSKFDATTVILSTAQKSPSYFIDSDKAMLNKIVDQQKSYSPGMQVPLAQFSSFIRDLNYNYGTLPGDNIGYQVSTTANPLKYSFRPAGVLGQVDQGNQVSLSPSIRKLASENSSVMESEFKKRLAVLNSDRIPLVQVGSLYKPENSSIVDTESGLCGVARILRNPENYFKSGEMVSFTIVSDENDNDPQGLNCVQNITEFTGAEDVVDGECRQRESTISYQTTLSSKTADICKINGSTGYNVRFTYPKISSTTNFTYRAVASAAQFIANYTDVTYPVQATAETFKATYTNLSYKYKMYAYQYLQTSVVYYNQSCLNIESDGQVTGQKCTVVNTPVTAIKDGNYTSDCYAFAKSFSANAINTDGYKPVCTTPYKVVGSCDVADVNCKQTFTLADKPVLGLAGSYDAAACLAKAKTYADYEANTAATCTDASKPVTTCSAAEKITGCTAFKAATYTTKTISQVRGTFDATACLNQAKIYSDYAAVGGTPTCKVNNKPVTTCSAAELTTGCVKSAEATYTTKTFSAPGDLTTTADGCYNYAKNLSDSAVTAAADVSGCAKVETTAQVNQDTTLNFSEVASYDSSTALLAVGSDCGAIKSLALTKVQKTVPQIAATDACSILAVNKTTESIENLTTDCTTQANNRCKTQNLGGCVGTFVSGMTSATPSAVTLFKKVNEDIKCASKCNSSVLNFCAEDNALDITVADYIKKKYGNTASCTELTKDIAGTAVPQLAVLSAKQQNTCQPNLQGIPSYFAVTKPAYRTKSVEVDYVAGSVKNDKGLSVPKSSLVDFIKERSQSLTNGQMVFSALVRRSPSSTYQGDSLGAGGTFGVDYEKLIIDTKGQIGSVLSNDYSLILKDLSSVLKSAIERTFVMQKMKPNQIIKKVYQLSKKSNKLSEIDKALWTQNGSTIIFSSSLEMGDGDQFKIEFANY
jgi:hypothetical protein